MLVFLQVASCVNLELLCDWPLPGICEVLSSFDAVSLFPWGGLTVTRARREQALESEELGFSHSSTNLL
jgi:hypothetical protein